VQFTRNPQGLRRALEKIDSDTNGGFIDSPQAEVLSHMFFANGLKKSFRDLLATHPPLDARIRALGNPHYQSPTTKSDLPPVTENAFMSLAETDIVTSSEQRHPDTLLIEAQNLLESIPAVVRNDCCVPHKATAIAVTTIVTNGTAAEDDALKFVRESRWFTASFVDYVRERCLPEISTLSSSQIRVVLQLSCATIRSESTRMRKELVEKTLQLIAFDKNISTEEICMALLMTSELLDTNTIRTLAATKTTNPQADLSTLLSLAASVASLSSNETQTQNGRENHEKARKTLGWKSTRENKIAPLSAFAILRAVGHLRATNLRDRRRFMAAVQTCCEHNPESPQTQTLLQTLATCLELPRANG
jgi:hypothetical protein